MFSLAENLYYRPKLIDFMYICHHYVLRIDCTADRLPVVWCILVKIGNLVDDKFLGDTKLQNHIFTIFQETICKDINALLPNLLS